MGIAETEISTMTTRRVTMIILLMVTDALYTALSNADGVVRWISLVNQFVHTRVATVYSTKKLKSVTTEWMTIVVTACVDYRVDAN